MREWYYNLRHVVMCRHRPGCVLCKILPFDAYYTIEKGWVWYIAVAWVMLYYGMLHG